MKQMLKLKRKLTKPVVKMTKQYQARKGSIISDKDALVIGRRIEQLMRVKGGELTPDEVVNDAASATSPLHKFFNWNDDEAARNWRMHQARIILGSIVEVVVIDGVRSEQRSFFNVTNDNAEKVYVTLETATSEKNYTRQLIDDCEQAIHHFISVLKLLRKNL